jgi:IclR family transcriptional regulator, acetate operon repressor
VIQILETVPLSPRGIILAELATALGAAKSSIQELTNGLLARGYLIEEDRRFHLGPGPFILAVRANKLAALSLDHRFVAELAHVLVAPSLSAFASGTPSSSPTSSAKNHPAHIRRPHPRPSPAVSERRGKALLANIPDDELNRLLDLASPQRAGEIRQFLARAPRDSLPPTRL